MAAGGQTSGGVGAAATALRKMTVSAMFLSIALVFKYFSFDMPLFGMGGVRISAAGIFDAMPAFLFGPLYGAAVSALTDVLGHFLKSQGAYMPLITVTAVLGGFLRGFLWKTLKAKNPLRLRRGILALAAALLIFGAYNMYALRQDGVTPAYYDLETPSAQASDSSQISALRLISQLLIAGTQNRANPPATLRLYITAVTWVLIIAGLFAAGLFAADFALARRQDIASFLVGATFGRPRSQEGLNSNIKKADIKSHPPFSVIFIVMLAAGLAVNTLNTVILRQMLFPAWQAFPFAAVWLPRAAEELISVTFYSYIIAILHKTPVLNRL